jgi:hypothetical protein
MFFIFIISFEVRDTQILKELACQSDTWKKKKSFPEDGNLMETTGGLRQTLEDSRAYQPVPLEGLDQAISDIAVIAR